MNKKIILIKAKTEEELTEKINKLEEETIATQIFQTQKDWVAFLWYEPKLKNEKEPNKDWKKEPAEEWMKGKLKSFNIAIPKELTKGKYYELLKENNK